MVHGMVERARPPAAEALEAAPAAGDPARLSGRDLFVLALAGLLPVVASPQVGAWFWTPKVALLLVAMGPGLVVLARYVLARDRAALAAVVFLAVAALATAVSPAPRLALLGLYDLGTGLLFVAACVAMWALGRTLSPRGRHVLVLVLVATTAANAVVAWFQTALPAPMEMLEPFQGRAAALLGNPVHVTALGIAALALVGYGLGTAGSVSARAWWLTAGVLLGGMVQLAGGRAGLALGVLLVGWIAMRFGPRTAGLLVLAVVIGAIAAGVVAGTGATSASGRVASSRADGLGGRVDRWALALPALEERPLLGYGPGQFRRATAPHTTPAAARAFGPDTLSDDAHDLVVEYATTTGLLGLAALGAWLWCAGRRARGPLAAFAVFGGCSLLIQPQNVALTPVLLVALGAAAPVGLRRAAPRLRVVIVVIALVGVVAAAALLRGDALLARATDELALGPARAATAALPGWSVGPATEARAAAYEVVSTHDPSGGDEVLVAARRAVARDPSDPRRWNELGDYEMRWGSRDAGRRAYEAANRANPWSVRALRARARIATEAGNRSGVARLCGRVHQVAPHTACPGGDRLVR